MLHNIRQVANMLKNSRPRLAMAMMVHNEEDCIAENIAHHQHLGFDAFFIIENASTDNTKDIINDIKKTSNIYIFDIKQDTYQQSAWMTMLNKKALRYGYNLVLNLDADEFLIPRFFDKHNTKNMHNDIYTMLSIRDCVVSLPRYNMLLENTSYTQNTPFWKSKLRVINPISYSTKTQVNQDNIAICLAPISSKVICNPFGLVRIKSGSHRVSHRLQRLNKRTSSDLYVAHYPFTTFHKFKNNIIRRQLLLAKNVRMGYHYKRWVHMLQTGGIAALEKEFARQIMHKQQIQQLLDIGVIQQDYTPSNVIHSTLHIKNNH